MLFLLFNIGNDRYVIDVRQVAEVLPLLGVKHIPLMPPGVAGVFNYRGKPVPVIDLNELTYGGPAAQRLSTRIVLVYYQTPAGSHHLLGLIAEKATELVRYDVDRFTEPGVTNRETPYLGPVVTEETGLTQWIDPQKLLPVSITEKLFAQLQEQATHSGT